MGIVPGFFDETPNDAANDAKDVGRSQDFETVRDLKLLLHQRLHVPPLRQRLVRAEGYGGTAEEAEVTEETSQVPKQISLVVLDYQHLWHFDKVLFDVSF